jgi:hypothetical protein
MHALARLPSRIRSSRVCFRPAHVAVSPAAHAALFLADLPLRPFLFRHEHGDWGLLRDDDARENEHALVHAGELLSEFELPTGEHILCLTTGDRALTSILCPGEFARQIP